MPGRKKPEATEAEKDYDYRKFEKRQAGETVVGEGGEDLDEKGNVGEVRERRREWNRAHPGHEDEYI